jgi:fibro-slime domain-containing protein
MTRLPTTSRPNRSSLCVVAVGLAPLFGACGGPVPMGTSHTGGFPSDPNNPNPTGGAILSYPVGGGAAGNTGTSPACDNNLKVVFRDFRCADDSTGARHPDFEQTNIVQDPGIVEATLGSDLKPVYAHGSTATKTVQSADTFNQWYRDTDGTNKRIESSLTLTPSATDSSLKVYNSSSFFPIDGQGWGNQSCLGQQRSHNYSFTTEIHTTFTYKGGETFTFTGDDDVFAFVNNKQVIDLGGIHSALSATVNMDSQGLTKGQTYPMDIFHAERHVTQSNFRMETRFDCLVSIIIQ